jgi:Rieske Fe-S protein
MSDETQDSKHAPNVTRRRFLTALVTVSGAAVAGTIAIPMVKSLDPTAAAAALATTTIDLSPIEPGMQMVALWQEKPVIVVNRTPEMLATLDEAEQKGILKDPNCNVPQQPPYCKNKYRSRVPEWYVGIKICNHCVAYRITGRKKPVSHRGGSADFIAPAMAPCTIFRHA